MIRLVTIAGRGWAAPYIRTGSMMDKPIPNVFRGKIKHVEHAPPYEIVTIELDLRHVAELTVAYIAVPGNTIADLAPGAVRVAAAHAAPASPPIASHDDGAGSTDGSSGSGAGDGTVTVTVPVPLAFINKPH
jgi:hypothetical protein